MGLTHRVGMLGLVCILNPGNIQAMLECFLHHLLCPNDGCKVQIIPHHLHVVTRDTWCIPSLSTL